MHPLRSQQCHVVRSGATDELIINDGCATGLGMTDVFIDKLINDAAVAVGLAELSPKLPSVAACRKIVAKTKAQHGASRVRVMPGP